MTEQHIINLVKCMNNAGHLLSYSQVVHMYSQYQDNLKQLDPYLLDKLSSELDNNSFIALCSSNTFFLKRCKNDLGKIKSRLKKLEYSDKQINKHKDNLYKFFTKQIVLANKFKNKATIFLVKFNSSELGDDKFNKPSIKLIKRKYPGMMSKIKRGDIIENILVSGNLAQGIFFFNGIKTIYQDDYRQIAHENVQGIVTKHNLIGWGSPPVEFKVFTEFPLDYWYTPHYERKSVNDSFEKGKSKFEWQLYTPQVIDYKQMKDELDAEIYHGDERNYLLFYMYGKEKAIVFEKSFDIERSKEIFVLSVQHLEAEEEYKNSLQDTNINAEIVAAEYCLVLDC